MPVSSVSDVKYAAMANAHVIDASRGALNLGVSITIIASGPSHRKG